MRHLFIASILVAALCASSTAFADDTPSEPPPTEARAFDAEHRQQIYESSKRSPTRAALYSAALPGMGNFYAEQPAFGVISLMALSFSAVFIGFALANDNDDAGRIGVVLAGATWVGSTTTAALGVRSHNRQLRRNLHLEANDQTSPTTASLDFTIRF